MKLWICFPQNGRFRDQTGGRETASQNGSLPFKTGGLEHMIKEKAVIGSLMLKRCSQILISENTTIKSKYLIKKVHWQQMTQRTTY